MNYIPHKSVMETIDNLNDVWVILERSKENVANYDDELSKKISDTQTQITELKNFIITNHIEG